MMRQHPDIFLPEVKEPRYFCKDFHEEEEKFYKNKRFKSKKYLYKNENEYMSLFKNAKGIVAGDFSPSYMYSKVAARNIKKFNSSSKIILILREPVNFLFSSFNQKQGSEEAASTFQEALSLEKERKKGKKIKVRAPPISQLFYSERVKYAEELKRYLKLFPEEKILIIIYEDFKKNNLKTCKQIFKFLGVNKEFIPEFKDINIGRSVRFIFLKSLLDSNIVLNFMRAFKTIIPKKLKNILNGLYSDVLFKTGKEKIDEKTRKKLMKKFKPEVKKINNLLKKKINKNLINFWGYDKI